MSVQETHPFYFRDQHAGIVQGYSTFDTAREALLAWIFTQRGIGEAVIEQPSGQWTSSQTTRWISDATDKILPLVD